MYMHMHMYMYMYMLALEFGADCFLQLWVIKYILYWWPCCFLESCATGSAHGADTAAPGELEGRSVRARA